MTNTNKHGTISNPNQAKQDNQGERTFRDKLNKMPKDRREKIESRGKDLIIEELQQENSKLKEELTVKQLENAKGNVLVHELQAELDQLKLDLKDMTNYRDMEIDKRKSDREYYLVLLDEAKQQSQWVSVDDRLPEENVVVHVTNYRKSTVSHYDDQTFTGFYRKGLWYESITGQHWQFVTHWMSLPDPPIAPTPVPEELKKQEGE